MNMTSYAHFAHHDSRGGDVLVRARSLTDAAEAYERQLFGAGYEGDRNHGIAASAAAQDYVGVVVVLTLPGHDIEDAEEGGELLATYGGPFAIYPVRPGRWGFPTYLFLPEGRPVTEAMVAAASAVVDHDVSIDPTPYEGDFGEDAWGVVLL